MKDNQKGMLLALIALFSWGIHGPAGRWIALQGVDMNFVFITRFWIGTIVLGLYLAVKGALKVSLQQPWKKLIWIILIGIIGNSFFYHMTLRYLSGTLVMLLENLAPIFVFLLSFLFLHIKPNLREYSSLGLAMIGLLVIVIGKDSFSNLTGNYYVGIGLGVLTGITFGVYIFLSSNLVKPYQKDPMRIVQFLFLIFFISSVIMTPFLFIAGTKPATFQQWFWLLEMGIFQSGLAYLFWNYALAYLSANTASILFLLTIVFTSLNEIIFLHMKMNFALVMGGTLICFAGYMLSQTKTKPPKLSLDKKDYPA